MARVPQPSPDAPRCAVCGEKIAPKEPVFKITRGSYKKSYGWTEKSEWGATHIDCFAKATQSPDGALAALRLLTK